MADPFSTNIREGFARLSRQSIESAIIYQQIKVQSLYRWRERIDAETFVSRRFRRVHGFELDFSTPARTTGEWWSRSILEMQGSPPTGDADKLAVKGKVANLLGPAFVVPTLWSGSELSSREFAALPDSFVLKANHGNGWHWLVRDKKTLSMSKLNSLGKLWLGQNYFVLSKEPQYRDIIPELLVEPLLQESDGSDAYDYKVHCFAPGTTSERYLVQVDSDRHRQHRQDFFDEDGMSLNANFGYTATASQPEKLDPTTVAKLVEASAVLAGKRRYLRADFYMVGGQPFVGELTHHPLSGLRSFEPVDLDRDLVGRLNGT